MTEWSSDSDCFNVCIALSPRYAVWLGMDKVKDQDLFYIAREGLKAPLPPPSARFLVVWEQSNTDVDLHHECGLHAWPKVETVQDRGWQNLLHQLLHGGECLGPPLRRVLPQAVPAESGECTVRYTC